MYGGGTGSKSGYRIRGGGSTNDTYYVVQDDKGLPLSR